MATHVIRGVLGSLTAHQGGAVGIPGVLSAQAAVHEGDATSCYHGHITLSLQNLEAGGGEGWGGGIIVKEVRGGDVGYACVVRKQQRCSALPQTLEERQQKTVQWLKAHRIVGELLFVQATARTASS